MECPICFDEKDSIVIHGNHNCCSDCLVKLKEQTYIHKNRQSYDCPFCRHSIDFTEEEKEEYKLKLPLPTTLIGSIQLQFFGFDRQQLNFLQDHNMIPLELPRQREEGVFRQSLNELRNYLTVNYN